MSDPLDPGNSLTDTLPSNAEAAHELAEILHVVMRSGVVMLRGGTMSFRVEQAMNQVALALGAERLDAYVTLTGITASVHRGHQHYTQISRVTSLGVDMNRVSAVEYLAGHMPMDATPQVIATRLDEIERLPPIYPAPLVMGAIAIACGTFALIQGGGLAEFLAAAVGAGLGQGARLQLRQWRLNPIPVTVICAAIATTLCALTLQGLLRIGLKGTIPQYGVLSSVLFLVPGMPLITAALDLVRFDLISGIARITYALLLLFSIAIGILIPMPLVNVSIL